jgi:predicted ATPase
MPTSFRLLQAYGDFAIGRRDPDSRKKEFGVDFAEQHARSESTSTVSIIIGRNGIGKSRLLSGIANVFDQLDNESAVRAHPAVSHLVYECDGRRCEISFDDDGLPSCQIDSRMSPAAEMPLPNKVIAMTTTPFDKFGLPRSQLRPVNQKSGSSQGESRPERYVYLGLRHAMQIFSATGFIYRALQGLFDASGLKGERRLRIAEVFGFLGYRPSIEVHYELKHARSWIEDIASGRDPQSVVGSVRTRREPFELNRMVERDPAILTELRLVCIEALKRAGGKRVVSLRSDFADPSDLGDNFFRDMQLLRRAGLARLRSAELGRVEDGTILDLSRASSGELGIVTSFLGLASVIEDGSLVLIDEPEISLHPEWQIQYVDLLLNTFRNFTGCHYVLATHSPLILSDVTPGNSSVVSLEDNSAKTAPANDLAGKSLDFLLATAFHVPGKNNLYLKQQIIKLLRLAANGDAESQEFAMEVKQLVELLPRLEARSPIAKVIRELKAVGDAASEDR